MSIDGGLRSLFHTHLKSGAHWQAIETGGTGLGIPDSNYCIDSKEGWVEFKQTDSWSVGMRPEQCSWLRTRRARGGVAWIAVRRKHDGGPRKGAAVDELWLCDGEWAQILSDHGLKHPDILWAGVWSGGPARWQWGEVGAILAGGR